MTIKVVVLDGARLPPGVGFPPLASGKVGWEQYPGLSVEQIAERCQHADILISLATPIDSKALEQMVKVGLLICAGGACDKVDQRAVVARGIELLAFPDADLDSVANAQDLCNRVSAAIDHYLCGYKDQGAGH